MNSNDEIEQIDDTVLEPIEPIIQQPKETIYTVQSGDTFLGILQKRYWATSRNLKCHF